MTKLAAFLTSRTLQNIGLFSCLMFLSTVTSFCQNEKVDSTQVVDIEEVIKFDSIEIKKTGFRKGPPNPKKAALLSLAPGVGQVYNWKYAGLKVPIIYGGLITLGIVANDREKYFLRLNKAYRKELAGETHEFQGRSASFLLSTRNAVDKQRQQAYISIGIVYFIQIIEAYVSAHLIDFDIDDDLSFRIKPSFENSPFGNAKGVGVLVEF